MKKIIIGTMLILGITACGTKTVYVTETTKPGKVSTTTRPVETTVYEQPVMSNEDQLIQAVKEAYGKPVYVEDSLILDVAYVMCEHFRSGGDSWTASELIVRSLPNQTQIQELAAVITAAGVVYLCPDQGYKLK